MAPPASTTAAQTPAMEAHRECKWLSAMENKRPGRKRVPRRCRPGWRVSSSADSDKVGSRQKKRQRGGVLAAVHLRLIQGEKNQPLQHIVRQIRFAGSAAAFHLLLTGLLGIRGRHA